MTSATKQPLSGAADGKGVLIAATATAGTTVHTADATAKDEVWLWASNEHTGSVQLSIEWGETSNPIIIIIGSKVGPVPIIPGWVLTNGLTCAIFAGTTNKVKVFGFVNRITN